MVQEPGDRETVGNLEHITVDRDLHRISGCVRENTKAAPDRGRPEDSRRACSLRWRYPDQVRGVPGRTPVLRNPPPTATNRVYTRSPRLGDGLHRVGIFERREIAGLAPQIGRADHPSHDLRAAGLRQVADEQDALGLQRLAHAARDAVAELTAQR